MLRLVKSHYHFRRVIPASLRPVFERREIWFSLRTADRLVARTRAAYLHGQTSNLFREALHMTPEEMVKKLFLMLDEQKESYEMILRAERTKHQVEMCERLLAHAGDVKKCEENLDAVIAAAKPLLADRTRLAIEKVTLAATVRTLERVVSNLARQPPISSVPSIESNDKTDAKPALRKAKLPISMVIAKHIENKKASADYIKNTKKSLSLFIECHGDIDVREINGQLVGDFRDALLSLPSYHGKTRRGLSIQEEIDRALAEDMDTLAPKTVSNHFSRISAAWHDLVRREIVLRNPWQGWEFDTTQKVIRRAWTDAELRLLQNSEWTRTSVPRDTYAAMTMVAAYTGMRLGEIANLRNEDIQEINGIQCFLIRPHDDGWTPKTAAGTRTVPIHSELLRLGITRFSDKRQKWLFAALRGSETRQRGQTFANEFSKQKTKIGLPLAVTFHGFRHTVSTKLRNVRADIREIWIDAMLGHEASHKSMGTLNYTSGIDVENLRDVVELIKYDDFEMRFE